MNPKNKYRAFPVIELDDRKWPSRKLTYAPIWCSVDLRDGNQALPIPMGIAQKLEMFNVLVGCGFKEIEVGFPASNDTEFEFVRKLIEDNRIPSDVTIQVLVQAREELIERTVESLVGARKAIIHLYNSTSPAQRRIVFGLEKPDIVQMAVSGTKWVKKYSERLIDTDVVFQYSPESFSTTEVEFSLEVCEAVMNTWQTTPERKMIINLPDTVEVAMPNVYADQIEWFCRHISRRDSVIISVHTHNDRGTGVAATEFGLLAGATRVEGTLFGNGERTGNLDIVTVALNLYTQGIDPCLDFSNVDRIREVYERCTRMTVPERQPYSGELVFTAFSGSHQDAIRKGLRASIKTEVWDVPYLVIDPKDVGRTYNEVIRVNGQSGKGGVAYLLENGCGIDIPKEMQREFGPIVNKIIDGLGREVYADELREMFWKEYIGQNYPYALDFFKVEGSNGVFRSEALVVFNGDKLKLVGEGNGPVEAFIHSLNSAQQIGVEVIDFHEHALGKGSGAKAIAYIWLQFPNGKKRWGAGVDTSIELASIRAVISALNRGQ